MPSPHDTPGARAIARWRSQLTDIGGPNTLLWLDDRGRGVLELTTAHPAGVARLFSSGSARLSQVIRESYAYAEASRRLRLIHAKVVELQEDRGLDACWLGVGIAHWEMRGAPQTPAAPVLLRRVRLSAITGHPDDLLIEMVGDPTLNPALAAYLRGAFGIDLDSDGLTALARAGSPSDPRQVFDELRRACVDVPGFVIERRQLISTFNLSKADLVSDLMDDDAAMHPVLDALSGDTDAREALRAVPPETDPSGLAAARGVLPTDSAQEAVLDAVLAGAHLTVDGAPGTGKTQTIANLVAVAAAQGRPVLLVSHKREAIESVQHRLAEVGLGEIVAHMSDGRPGPEFEEQFNRRIQQAIASVEVPAAAPPSPSVATELQRHHEAMHEVHQPWAVSLAQTLQQIAALGDRRPAPRSHVRLDGADLVALSPTQRDETARRLLELARKGAWPTTGEHDPWYAASVVGKEQAGRTRASVMSLAESRLAEHRAMIEELFDQVGLPSPVDMRAEQESLELLQRVADTLEVFRPEVYEAPLPDLAAATGGRAYRKQTGRSVSLVERRRLVAQATELLRPGPRPDVHGVLVRAERQRAEWRRIAGKGSRPAAPKGLARAIEEHEAMRAELEWLGDRLAPTADGGDLLDESFDTVQARLGRLAHSIDRLDVLPTVAPDLQQLRAQGFGPLVDDLAARQVEPEQAVTELEFVWWTSVFKHLRQKLSDRLVDGARLNDMLEAFCAADAERREELARLTAVRIDERLRNVVRSLPEQVRAVQQGLARGSSLRELLPVAPELMMALMPCWAMSPLLVPSHVPPGVWFDIVVVDEASQVGTAEAVPAVRRAAQTVLFGDHRQLRPTAFAVDAGRAVSTVRQASILDELSPLVPRAELDTHYRSYDATLFEFANSQAYAGRVRSFPAPRSERSVQLDIVDTATGAGAEVEHVAELVAARAQRPGAGSLLILTLTDEHAERVRTAISRRAATDRALRAYLDRADAEPVMVRTAARAQGLSRDEVILTTGCRLSPQGELVGAVATALADEGERLLVVATTRARRRLIVISGFHHGDVAVATLGSRGAQMYRDLLVHAGSGSLPPQTQADGATGVAAAKPGRRRRTASSGSVLERRVAPVQETVQHPLLAGFIRRLQEHGVPARPSTALGMGAAGAGIDLVIDRPGRAGEPVLAIDSDGAGLGALLSVRDRDLVRPTQLRARGWQYDRVALEEIFIGPAQQVARLADRLADDADPAGV